MVSYALRARVPVPVERSSNDRMGEATVYRVRWADLNRYQAFLFDVDEADASFDLWGQFAGVSLADTWVPLPIYSDQPRLERPSFWHLVGAGVIVMDREVIT